MKQILILGGTNFIGRVLVEKLLQQPEYQLTLFNRGKRNVGIFPGIAQIHGDREMDDYKLIANQNWDYIIDCSGYYPLSFEKLLQAIKGKVGRYIFISTISVFDLDDAIGKTIDETTALLPCTDEQKVSPLMDAYGEKKAEMERVLLREDWLDKIILRPSLVYGKYDFTDRFYYWLWRAKFSDKIMLPDNGRDSSSLTNVDDLSDLIIASLKAEKHNTTYNAITHDATIRTIAETCANQLGTKPEMISVPAEKILAAEISPWQDIALWMNGDLKISNQKAKKDFGIEFSSFADSVKGTIAYYESLNWPDCKYGMSIEKEKTLF